MLADEELPQDSDASRSPRTGLAEGTLHLPTSQPLGPSAFRPRSAAPVPTMAIKAQPSSPQGSLELARNASPRPVTKAAAGAGGQALPAPSR